ncbi:MAG: hypothetical protein Q9162_006048 [Coniocarpon cinnabarinum]
MSANTLPNLAKVIQENAAQLEEYFHTDEQPMPSFEPPYPPELPLSPELHTLNGTSLQLVYNYDVATKVPLHGDISFASLAKACDLEEADVRRMLRFAMIHHRVF